MLARPSFRRSSMYGLRQVRWNSAAAATAQRAESTVDFEAAPFSEQILRARLAQHLAPPAADEAALQKIAPETTLSALLACVSPQLSKPALSDSETTELQLNLLSTALDASPAVAASLTPDTLRTFFLTSMRQAPNSSTPAAIAVLKAYTSTYSSGRRNYVPTAIGLIPFRRAVYSGDLDQGFAILDLTAAAPGYLKHVSRLWWRFGRAWVGGSAATLAGVHALLKSGLVGVWPSTLGVLAMVAAYIGNMTILAGLAFAGRVSGSGDVLKWLPGTPTTYWYTHAQEMKLASLIASVDRSLPENQDECSFRVRKLLEQRAMVSIEYDQETLMKEYWARGGEGFEWVEPDQDPADILWRRKMEASKPARLAAAAAYGDKYKYADDLLPKMEMPHASLIDHPKAPELDSKDSRGPALPGN